MSYTTEEVINDISKRSAAAYEKIEDATRELYLLGAAESAITLSVRVMYREIEEEREK